MDGRRGEARLPLRRRRRRRAGRLPARSRTGHSPPRKRSKRLDFLTKNTAISAAKRSGCSATVSWRTATAAKPAREGSRRGFPNGGTPRWTRSGRSLPIARRTGTKRRSSGSRRSWARSGALFDDTHGWFTVTRARNLAEENPDILDYSQLTGSRLDVDEDRCELKRQDKDGKQPSGKRRRRSPRPQRPVRGPARHAAGQTPPDSASTAVRRDPEKHLKRKGKTP